MADTADRWAREYQAVEEIFTGLELGADPAQWPALDAETKKQIQQAVGGVSRRGWDQYWSYCFRLDSNNGKELFFTRILFAIHGGIPAKKTAWLFDETSVSDYDDHVLAAVLRRGDRFAAALTREMIQRASRGWRLSLALELRHRFDLDTEFTPSFAAAWAGRMYWTWTQPISNTALEKELAWAPELFTLASTVPGNNEDLMGAAIGMVRREVMDAATVIPLVIQNLGMVSRPLDRRRVWETLRELGASETTLRGHYRSFLEALSAGDGGSFYEELVPVLVDPADDGDDRLVAVVLAAMMTTTKKARRQLLGWLRQRPAPTDPALGTRVLEILAEQDPRGDFDKEITALQNAWGMTAPTMSAPAVELVAWTETPDLWTPERLLPADIGQDAQLLIEQLGELSTLAVTDRFLAPRGAHLDRALALIWRMEQRDLGSAALICAGMPKRVNGSANPFAVWGRGTDDGLDGWSYTSQVLRRIREIPVLLSSPRDISLLIRLDDLIAGLQAYGTGEVIAADLKLALNRLETWSPHHEGPTQQQLSQLADLGAVFADGDLPEGASSAQVGDWVVDTLRQGAAPTQRYTNLWEFPTGGVEHLNARFEAGLTANLATPWSPEMASILLGRLSSPYGDFAQRAEHAVVEGYHRGLLHPGVAKAKLLEHSPAGQVARMASLAEALLPLAFEEDMLPVVWLLLCDIVDYSAGDGRTATGLKRVLEVMAELAPSIFTQDGVPEVAKEITGVRQIAQRSGSSATVRIAREIVAQAPVREVEISFPARPVARKLWVGPHPGVPVIEDKNQEVWQVYDTPKSSAQSIARERLEAQLREITQRDGWWQVWDQMTSMAVKVEPTAFVQVAAGIIDETGPGAVSLARWVLYALREDEYGREDPRGLVSRTWPMTRQLLAWAGQRPKVARETAVFLDAAIVQATEVVQAVVDGEADPSELVVPELEQVVGKSANVARKVAHLKAWLEV